MYHKIKTLRQRHSIRQCAALLGISVNTVRKYERMNLQEASDYLPKVKRCSQFDQAREFVVSYLENFPKISASKLYQKVVTQHPDISAKERAFRKWVAPIRSTISPKKQRRYEPIIDMQPGQQVQVDGGECWVQSSCIASEKFKVYFIAFVFSYSRMAYLYFQERPFKTNDFIKAHLAAFQFFGGIAKEYVYDQSKLVVIQEKYGEVVFNQQFHKFANRYQFLPKVCEGYDPESKGKVERFIRYTKENFLYGDYFVDIEAVRKAALVWLAETANSRLHDVTKQQPVKLFAEEYALLNRTLVSPQITNQRLVDKTGLFSYAGNKYSVPLAYHRKQVAVMQTEHTLQVFDTDSSCIIAEHQIPECKGHILKNPHHYQDLKKSIHTLEAEALSLWQACSGGAELVGRIKNDNPKIVRKQLKGLISLYKKYPPKLIEHCMPRLLQLPHIRVSLLESILEKEEKKQQIKQLEKQNEHRTTNGHSGTLTLDRPLEYYMNGEQNVE